MIALENDLASIDMSLAEYYIESGINPIPTACDGYDFEVFDLPNKELAKKFVAARNNMQQIVLSLAAERTLENEEALGLVVSNFNNKINLMLQREPNYKHPSFSFVDLYNQLKIIQNSLGILVPSSELNVISFFGEDCNIDEKKEEIMKYISRLVSFNNAAKQIYENARINTNSMQRSMAQDRQQTTNRVLNPKPQKIMSKSERQM